MNPLSFALEKYHITPDEVILQSKREELHIKKQKISYFSKGKSIAPFHATKTISLIMIALAFSLAMYAGIMFTFATSMFVIPGTFGIFATALTVIEIVISGVAGAILMTKPEEITEKTAKALRLAGLFLVFTGVAFLAFMILLTYAPMLLGALVLATLLLELRTKDYIMFIVDGVQIYIHGEKEQLASLYAYLTE